jgi:hypothetical protein
MGSEFLQIARHKHAYHPLLVLAADFFVPHWKYLLPGESQGELDSMAVAVTQAAARAAVDHLMSKGEIFWHCNFSEAAATRTWKLFERRTKVLATEPLDYVRELCVQLLAPDEEAVAVDALVELVTRLRNDLHYRVRLGYSNQDADLLEAAHERLRSDVIFKVDFNTGWLDSLTPWDIRLRDHTPDLPEFVAQLFGTAFDLRTRLPHFRQNLRLLLETDEAYRAFVKRLRAAFERGQSPHSLVKFPSRLLA